MTDFKSVPPRRTISAHRLWYLERGQIKLTNYAIYFGAITYRNLGEPEYVGVAVDDRGYLIRLTAETNRTNGWKPKLVPVADPNFPPRYEIRATKYGDMNKLPKGIYIPTGGEVYAYKLEANQE